YTFRLAFAISSSRSAARFRSPLGRCARPQSAGQRVGHSRGVIDIAAHPHLPRRVRGCGQPVGQEQILLWIRPNSREEGRRSGRTSSTVVPKLDGLSKESSSRGARRATRQSLARPRRYRRDCFATLAMTNFFNLKNFAFTTLVAELEELDGVAGPDPAFVRLG